MARHVKRGELSMSRGPKRPAEGKELAYRDGLCLAGKFIMTLDIVHEEYKTASSVPCLLSKLPRLKVNTEKVLPLLKSFALFSYVVDPRGHSHHRSLNITEDGT